MDECMNEWIDRSIDGWMDGSIDGWMDGWMDECMNEKLTYYTVLIFQTAVSLPALVFQLTADSCEFAGSGVQKICMFMIVSRCYCIC